MLLIAPCFNAVHLLWRMGGGWLACCSKVLWLDSSMGSGYRGEGIGSDIVLFIEMYDSIASFL